MDTDEDGTGRPRRLRRLGLLVGSAVLVLGIGLLAVVWLSLDRGPSDRTTGTVPSTTATPAPPAIPAPTGGTRPTARSSTVPSTGTATARVGEPCGQVEGLTETAADGGLVTCRRGDGGRLTWEG